MHDGTQDREEQEAYRESLACLTDAELEMLENLLTKVEAQDSSIIIVPDEEKAWPPRKTGPARRKQGRTGEYAPDQVRDLAKKGYRMLIYPPSDAVFLLNMVRAAIEEARQGIR